MSQTIAKVQGDSSAVNVFKPEQFVGDKRLLRNFSRWLLDFCQTVFRREPDETQQFLEVGCGIGDLTRDELLPRCLPCRRIVAVDLSAEMVEHSTRHSHHEKIEYGKLDIASDEDVAAFVDEHGLFDRVYSFYTLSWARDQAKALKNVARLLKPRGECLLVFHASVEPIDVNRNVAKMERWSKYYHLVEQVVPKTHDLNDDERVEYISTLLAEAGLSPSILELPVFTGFDGYSLETLADMYMVKSPIFAVLSEEEKHQFQIGHGTRDAENTLT
ncbi:juvenile hormone acid O-methyltransferase [Dermacentor silvarum]|uniref:juvenile hormone acid O-methyltransferase n=1 Tax=Dermacentor silvarum TaxID=543639 RepID=UPI00210123AD|nr:juvenile hormone acid O-methyltransferase [Dermacentor silvarum]